MALSWVCFACMNALVKHACTHLPFPLVLFFKNGIALCCLSPLFFKEGKNLLKAIQSHFSLLFLRAMGGILISYLMFASLCCIPLTDALLLSSTGPLFLPLVLYFWLKQRTHWIGWTSVTVGFLGVLCIFQPTEGIWHFGSIFALLAGLLTAVVMIIIQKLPKHLVPAIIFCYLFAAALGSSFKAVPLLFHLQSEEIPILIFVGLFFGIGQWLYTNSLRHADATSLAPFLYMFVVTGIFLDWWMWEKIPSFGASIGILLVILGGCVTLFSLKPPLKERTERDSNP